MSELRWNPLLEEWVVSASHRLDRPLNPRDQCPFCPGSGLVPETYDVHIYQNDFPTFATPPPVRSVNGSPLYKVADAAGQCDVVLYHPDHTTTLAQLPVQHIRRLIDVWRNRFVELARRPEIHYVLIFENKGEVIGVTMPHPHGQIYAFPYIPPKIKTELDASKRHFETHKRCLICDMVQEEVADGRRLVAGNSSWVAFVPFFARFPYEVHIVPREHCPSMKTMTDVQRTDLAPILKTVLMKYDGLFGFSFPYMMLMHQSPVDGGEYPYYHFHVEFYPPHRAKDKLKYLAGCETGAGTFINDTSAEEKAEELRGVTVAL